MTARRPDAQALERRIGRMMVAMTYVAIALLLVGVALMAAAGISPLDASPAFAPGAIVSGVVALDPEAFLWLGLIVSIATPISRVIAAAVGYWRTRDWLMVTVSVAILGVIALAITLAVAGAG